MIDIIYRTGPERQRRYFKAMIIKWQRKLNRMGEHALGSSNFSSLIIEGNALMTFAAIDAMLRVKEQGDVFAMDRIARGAV